MIYFMSTAKLCHFDSLSYSWSKTWKSTSLVKESNGDGYGMMIIKNQHLPFQANSQQHTSASCKQKVYPHFKQNTKGLKGFVFEFSTFYVCVGTHPSSQHLIVVTRMKLLYPKSKPLYLPRLHPWAWQGRSNLFCPFCPHVVPWLGMTW